MESAVYFACMEAVTNAVKDARAGSVEVVLEAPSPSRVELTVRDDGIGFDTAAVPAGTGLAGTADRLSVLDGGMEVTSTPGGGTTVRGWADVAHAESYSSTA